MALQNSFKFFPEEAKSIALIIASYGWIEFILAYCTGHAIGGEEHGIRTIFPLTAVKRGSRLLNLYFSQFARKVVMSPN
jgi:hypothetical protein